MNLSRMRMICSLAVLMAAASTAQAKLPSLGHLWPAGGQRGTTVEVTVYGQNLKDANVAHISGDGVRVTIKDYIGRPSGKDKDKLRDIQKKAEKVLREKAKEEKKKDTRPSPAEVQKQFIKMAKKEGVTDNQLEAYRRYRQQRSDPKQQLNPQYTDMVKLSVTMAADAEPGLRELRLGSNRGMSTPIRFCVGQLPEMIEAEPNDKIAGAMSVAQLPVLLNGQIMPGDIDRFRITARKGTRLVVSAEARHLVPYLADAVPGWFQATMAIYDDSGREVAYADDYRFDPDPVLLYEVPRDGEYVIEIRDAIYRGREDFVYRVSIGELPFVSSIFPLGAQRGKPTSVSVEGWNLPAGQLSTEVTREEAGVQPFLVRGKRLISNAVPFATGELVEMTEEEPNDSPATSEPVTLPLTVNGRINTVGDWDVYRFQAKAGDEIVAEVHARRLGSPVDSLLKLTDSGGQVLAIGDDHEDKGSGLNTHHADSLLSARISKSGTYQLWIGDAQNKGGPAYGYRLRISPRRPDFDLRIVPSIVTGRAGDLALITVHALRHDGFDGDIALQLKDAPEGFVLDGWLPAGQDKVLATLRLPPEAPKTTVNLQLEGRATIGQRDVTRPAVPADDTMQAFLYRHLVPAETWMVSVTPYSRPKARLKLVGDPPVRLPLGEKVTVRMESLPPTYRRDLRLKLNNAPEGMTVSDAKVLPKNSGFTFVLSATADKIKVGLKGNLIIEAFTEYTPKAKKGEPPPKMRLSPVGTLPAIPFEIVPSTKSDAL